MRLTAAEWKVMDAVWRRKRATARDVHDALAAETGWAYTTVKTMLVRLAEKAALKERREGNRWTYEARLTRRAARRAALAALADRAFDGAFGSMAHFLLEDKRLSARERAGLRRLLEEES